MKFVVWQANDEGFHDVQQKGPEPDFNLRGVFRTGADERYQFSGVKPKYYAIPDDGPVGRLLGALGRHRWRQAHLHYILSAPGYQTLVTHIFDPDDPYIGSDAVFGVKQSLLRSDRSTRPSRPAPCTPTCATMTSRRPVTRNASCSCSTDCASIAPA